LKGQLIESNKFNAGNHDYTWSVDNQASGIYFYQLKAINILQVRKMLLQ
jgi:hypothetical protein